MRAAWPQAVGLLLVVPLAASAQPAGAPPGATAPAASYPPPTSYPPPAMTAPSVPAPTPSTATTPASGPPASPGPYATTPTPVVPPPPTPGAPASPRYPAPAGPPPAQPLAAPAFPQQGPAASLRVVVLRTRPVEVDPSAAGAVDAALHQHAADRRLADVPGADGALMSAGLTYPRSPADVWQVTRSTGADLGVYATVRSQGGRYVVFVTVADAAGGGPYLSERSSGAEDLGGAATEALDEALTRAGVPHPGRVEPHTPTLPADLHLWQLGLGTRGAIGLTDPLFYNHLAGLSIRRRFSQALGIGVAVSYANLKGPDGRAHNVLPEIQLDYRFRLTEKTWRLPLRASAGYLPRNGPTLQVGAGLGAALSDSVELSFDLVAPMFWISDDLAVTSMNLGVELGIDL